jgi:transcriptional regulator with XRE-family HTH domain
MREEVRCGKCLLNQFMTISHLCRKCRAPLDPIPDAPEPHITMVSEIFSSVNPIAERLKGLRKSRHISQIELSERMGCQRTYISKVESGRALPKVAQIKRFAAAFNISTYEFLLTPEEIRRQNFLADPFLAAIAEDLPKLSPDRRMEVLRFAGLLERQRA